jgi:hypothetical protein
MIFAPLARADATSGLELSHDRAISASRRW